MAYTETLTPRCAYCANYAAFQIRDRNGEPHAKVCARCVAGEINRVRDWEIKELSQPWEKVTE